MNAKLQIAFFVLFGILTLVELIWLFMTERRLKRFFLGKKGKDLEDTLEVLEKDLIKLKEAKQKTEKELVEVNKKLRKSIRGLETIRFNPFQDQGSNQSFAVGFLNEEGNGVVLSSLYARDRMSVFAKPIKGGKSDYDLTEEEIEVLKKAEI